MTVASEQLAKELPLNTGVHILAQNEDGLIALDKPYGAMSHPNKSSDKKRSLLVADYDLEKECYTWTNESGETRHAWLINRLDSPTSGVILLGLNPEISEAIKHEFSTHKVLKIYFALVRGKLSSNSGTWADRLKKQIVVRGRLAKHGRVVEAKTGYQLIKTPTGGFPISLLRLMPMTGRTHQLRVQCKKHKLPIVGDRTYGNFSFNKEITKRTDTKRMMLHSGETIVNYTFKGKVRKFSAKSELPEDFNIVMAFRPGLNLERQKSLRSSSIVLAQRRFKAE